MFRSEKAPAVPPGPTQQKLSKSISSIPSKETPIDPKAQTSGMMGVLEKVNPFRSSPQGRKDETSRQRAVEESSLSVSRSSASGESKEAKVMDPNQNTGMISGFIQMVNPFRSPSQRSESSSQTSAAGNSGQDKATGGGQNPGLVMGLIQKVNPFRSSQNPSNDDPTQDADGNEKEALAESESEAMLPSTQKNKDLATTEEGGLGSATPTEPSSPKVLGFEWNHFKKDSVEIPTAAEPSVPSEGSPQQADDDEDFLLEWWGAVEGWNEWNESANFDGEDAEQAVEAAADRVFMAARLFVHLFNQREASLHQRVLEMLALADAADSFHKKTVTASVGGGVASVAGSITTITGLALAPFTFGTSLIVTAVGIGVATAGGITSASANITDTMHSRTDRAKVEQIILGYQEEISDIKECLQFLQAGMETLEEWNFEQYVDSISKRAMNKNVKHVMKEGGRAGKALLINTESLVSTVQVLGAAGGAAKAAQAITVASGVMSGLFLALDVFFLAKDSMELRKGAKTEFAAKIRDVCKELQDGLLELRKIKEQLEAIMEDAEEEEEEEEEDGDAEEEEEEKEEGRSVVDPKKPKD
ncbi:uncharacterized protein si:cabz01007802.1 isoform X1 [Pygocentrus nattereri]|uniref:Uncharacterized protein n=1 Tax=Pygocentrus nattereri TaxID=42514 RepID=A0AAR2LLQ3_PYGNA|nr:uncharacterized protein si:cabz01007802.1 isoform X1 [Pygocentrus nattereri]XP_017570764.2 uncharacterized protein si:cabz01007802.1 isoform X1 [Pygocentrus nattereri]